MPRSPSDQLEVLAIGETMAVMSADAEWPSDATVAVSIGGAESNVAYALAARGHRVAWASALGVDSFGDLIAHQLSSAGVDLSGVRRDPEHRTGFYFKQPLREPRVVYYRADSAASRLGIGDLRTWLGLHPRVVHVSGITAALSPTCHELLRRIVVDRALGDAVVSFDVNHRPSLWRTDAGTALRVLADAADIVFVGRDEAAALWGTGDLDSVRRVLPHPRHLIVKDAEVDAVEFEGDHRVTEAALAVEVVDAVGAGDAFAAGWLSGWLRGEGSAERLRMGHDGAAAALRSSSDTAVAR